MTRVVAPSVARGMHLAFALFLALIAAPAAAQPHPGIFLSKSDASAIRDGAAKYPLLGRSLAEAKSMLAEAMAKPTDVPQPGEAGGYAHERHKQNYREMQA